VPLSCEIGKEMKPGRRLLRKIVVGVLSLTVGEYALCGAGLVMLRWINPWTTAVQIERRVQAFRQHRLYTKRYEFVSLSSISPNLQHAVVAAEDGRFLQHHGFDWVEMQKVLEDDVKRHRLGRGGSTITQQLVKNLFLTTERSFVRKGVESSLVPVVEAFLPKDRILELYLNVIEWGPGIYGAEAACEHYYHSNASELSREQAARLAAIIPAPLKRKPAQMNEYSAEILYRMEQTGW
jgi:monofunctional biosynthetic peptidoglycan transglycosylase